MTVRQPWAWAIVHADPPKDVENRTQAWSYRGPLAIHAGLTFDGDALDVPVLRKALPHGNGRAWEAFKQRRVRGAIVGVVDLVDVHTAAGLEDDPWEWCCQPWGEPPGITLRANGTFTGPRQHLVLAHPRPLPVPIPCRGQLGLWTPPAAVLEQLVEATA